MAKENKVPVYPGTMTPSEVQHAFNLGLNTVTALAAEAVAIARAALDSRKSR